LDSLVAMVAGGGFECIVLAYGGKQFLKLLTTKDLFPFPKSALHDPLLDIHTDLLHEIAAFLPIGSFVCCLHASRSTNQVLEKDFMWKRLSISSWPCAAPSADTAWRDFVRNGGGASIGKVILKKLRAIEYLKCPGRHQLQRIQVNSGTFNCDMCGKEEILGLEHSSEKNVWGCRECNYDLCESCVKGGVMKSADGAANVCSEDGWTSLHYACRHGLIEVVATLLDSRADVEVKDFLHGYTPLMVGATHGHADVCSMLLARGAAKGTCNKFNRTAYACASAWSQLDLLPMLSPLGVCL